MKKLAISILMTVATSLLTWSQSNDEIKFGLGNARVVKYAPTSDLIAIAVGSRVKLFRSGFEIATLTSHNSKIDDLNFDSEGENLVVGHNNGKVSLWNVKNRKLTLDIRVSHHQILGCEYLESTGKLAILSRESLSIWTDEGRKVHETYNHYGQNHVMDVSEDGNLIAVADNDNRIGLYDNRGELLNELNSDQKEILSIAFSPNEKHLATGSKMGTVYLWDVNKQSPIKSMLDTHGRINSLEFSNNSQFLAVGGEYFFILSLSDEHPDLIYKKLNGAVLGSSFNPNGKEVCILEDLTPNAEIVDISDLNIPPVFKLRDEGDAIAPQIYISNPPKLTNDRINFSAGMIDLQGSIFDDYGVRSLRVNGIETPIRENGKFIIHLPLSMGENHIDIQARDINGNIALKKFIINRKDDTDIYDHQVARNYLFVVGIDDYQFWPRLNNAVKDGNDLASVLMSKYQFDFSDITFLKNEQATKNNIYKGLRSLIERVTPKDNLMVYFSGHGHFDELLNEGFWIPADANLDSQADYLSNTSILKIVESIDTQHTLLVADACFSGSLFSDTHRGGYYEKVDKYKSRWGLASGRLEVVSDGNIGVNSPFSLVLLNFLKENSKDELAVSELIQHVKMKVSELSDQTPIGNPMRMKGDEGGEFIFRKANPRDLASASQQ